MKMAIYSRITSCSLHYYKYLVHKKINILLMEFYAN